MIVLKTRSRSFFSLIFLTVISMPAMCQSRPFEEQVYLNDSLNTYFPREKIFIHRDKPYYKIRDTIWLKGYILTGLENIPNDSSRLAYIELIDAQNEVVKRTSAPCFMGLFAANIYLNERSFKQGEYRLRAYTRYMMNFGDSLFFERRFAIINPGSEEWRTRIQELKFADDRLLLSATLSGQSNQLANRAVTVRLRSKNKILFRARATTDRAGRIYIDTLLRDADKQNLQLEITDKDDIKLQVPVRHEKGLIDLQFLPEGGSFIAGRQQRLGFKAINAFGKGTDVKGVIKDSKGSVVTKFASVHKGMGVVSFTPVANEMYTATLESGLSFRLPSPQTSGIILQVMNHPADDSIQLKIEGSSDIQKKTIYFIAQSRGITGARGRVVISAAKGYELKISKAQLLPGITIFTLYDEMLQPINGRAIFITPRNSLKLTLVPHKAEYFQKDSVSLTLNVQNQNSENISGSFSMAVLDTSQVKVLPDEENLLSYMLLSSDLKGEIEEPYYYFKHPDPEAIEVLMLTQGWVSYSRSPGTAAFAYEKEFGIEGRVSNAFNKSLSGVNVTVFGKVGRHKSFFLDGTTNAKGDFSFTRFPLYETDSVSMLIRALNKRDKAFNVGVELKEMVYPPVNTSASLYGNGSVLSDTMAIDYMNKQERIKSILAKEGIILEEVIVKSKRRIQGSHNLNEDGGADQVIDEETLNKTPKETLLNVLQKQVKGFRLGVRPRSGRMFYMINTNIVRLVIDGIDVHRFFQPMAGQADEYKLFLDNYLTSLDAEDIKGIEIMNSSRYNATYKSGYLSIEELINHNPVIVDFSFIEVTTHSGQGAFLKKTPGMYLLKPVYPALPRQFYSPRYTSPQQKTIAPDLRNTVYWSPFVTTDTAGKAHVSFYTSESNSSYFIIIQGTDLKGNFGVLYQPLRVSRSRPVSGF